ncbi:protein of unknown function [Pseudomonas sp. JV551A1]|uniref:Uncharacterized protein n=1 Tax=Pseudomonas inefficax TaxID=2078786 RepID=A0AAQ1P653_9PSED|nr:protein of unknown function [Pseudomonas sp. JV551A1]SPO58435.1 protein of unknown function [Pseudomonas inefficax]
MAGLRLKLSPSRIAENTALLSSKENFIHSPVLSAWMKIIVYSIMHLLGYLPIHDGKNPLTTPLAELLVDFRTNALLQACEP